MAKSKNSKYLIQTLSYAANKANEWLTAQQSISLHHDSLLTKQVELKSNFEDFLNKTKAELANKKFINSFSSSELHKRQRALYNFIDNTIALMRETERNNLEKNIQYKTDELQSKYPKLNKGKAKLKALKLKQAQQINKLATKLNDTNSATKKLKIVSKTSSLQTNHRYEINELKAKYKISEYEQSHKALLNFKATCLSFIEKNSAARKTEVYSLMTKTELKVKTSSGPTFFASKENKEQKTNSKEASPQEGAKKSFNTLAV